MSRSRNCRRPIDEEVLIGIRDSFGDKWYGEPKNSIRELTKGNTYVCKKTAVSVMNKMGCTTITKHNVITTANNFVISKGEEPFLVSPLDPKNKSDRRREYITKIIKLEMWEKK